MIPTLLVVGLAIGLAAHRLISPRVALAVLAVASVGWGVLVGVAAGNFGTFAAGTAVAAANLAIAAAVALLCARLFSAVTRGHG